MANLIILAGGGRNLNDSALIPSVVMTVEHSMSNTISSYPIEKLSDGLLNSKKNNNIITMTGAFSTIHLPGLLKGVTTPDLLSSQITEAVNRPQAAFDLLERVTNNSEFVDLVTGFTTYKNCLIKTFTINEDVTTSNLLSFQIVFEQPRFIAGSASREIRTANIIEQKKDSAADNVKGSTSNKKKVENEFALQDVGDLAKKLIKDSISTTTTTPEATP